MPSFVNLLTFIYHAFYPFAASFLKVEVLIAAKIEDSMVYNG